MADEAIIRVVIEEGGKGATGPSGAVPPEPARSSESQPAYDAPVLSSLRNLRTAVEGLTSDFLRAAAAIRQAQYAPVITSKPAEPKLLTYQPQAAPASTTTGTPAERLRQLAQRYRYKASKEDISPSDPSKTGFSEKELEAYYAEQNAIRDEFSQILADAKLTKRQREVVEHVMLGGSTGAEIGVSKGRITQLKRALANKLGIPELGPEPVARAVPSEKLSQHAKYAKQYEEFVAKKTGQYASEAESRPESALARLAEEGREQAARDQGAAGSRVDFLREQTEGLGFVERVPLHEQLATKFTDAYMREAKKKEPNAELLGRLGKALEKATLGKLGSGAMRAALKAKSTGASLEALHLAGGGPIPALFGTPSHEFPDPPAHWSPEMMDMYPKDALQKAYKSSGNDVEAARAVADYVHKYSLSPKNVYKRVLENMANRDPEGSIADFLGSTRKATNAAMEFQPEYPSAKHMAEGGPTGGEPWKELAAKHFSLQWESVYSNYGSAENVHKRWIEMYKQAYELQDGSVKDFVDITFGLQGQKSARDQQKSPDKSTFEFMHALLAFAKDMKAAGIGIRASGSTEKRNTVYEKGLAQAGMEKVGTNLFFKDGGRIDMSRGGNMPVTPHAASGQDWHPAWLTDREFVVNQKSADKNRNALAAANANPDVVLRAEHFAAGGLPYMARLASNVLHTSGATNVVGPRGPVQPAVSPAITNALAIAGGPVGMAVSVGAQLVGDAQKAFHNAVVGTVGSLGTFARAVANPDANPARLFTGVGGTVSAATAKFSELTSVMGVDLFPGVKLLGGVVGETAKQFGALMDAVDGTAKRYAPFSATIGQAQGAVELQHTIGELRRAQEAGPELARYLRAQGDLQQRVEDVKIKILTKILPAVTSMVGFAEGIMAVVENATLLTETIASPLTAAVAALNRIASAQEDAARPVIEDPTTIILSDNPAQTMMSLED